MTGFALHLDDSIVQALAWTRRVGGCGSSDLPHGEAFHRAEELGLLAHDPIWRTTREGDGVLVAVGLLPCSDLRRVDEDDTAGAIA